MIFASAICLAASITTSEIPQALRNVHESGRTIAGPGSPTVWNSRSDIRATAQADSNNRMVLLDRIPTPGKIVREEKVPSLGIIIWTLSNGMRVILKPTTLHPDQILLRGYSWGGYSVLPNEDRTAAQLGNSMLRVSGVGRFDKTALGTVLTDQGVGSISRGILPDRETVSGVASARGASALLQLVHLIFTAPRLDTAEARAGIANGRAELSQAAQQLAHHFRDSLRVALWQHHPRSANYSVKEIERTDVNRTFAILRDRFSDASGFTLTIVGSFSVDQLRSDVERYLASLPSVYRQERWKDNGMRFPDTVTKMTFPFGALPRSSTAIVFNSPVQANREPHQLYLNGLAVVFNERLQARFRRQLSNTYNVNVTASFNRYPVSRVLFQVEFQTSPERVGELSEMVLEEAETMRRDGLTSDEVTTMKRQVEEEISDVVETNDFWANTIEEHAMSARPWKTFATTERLINAMTRESLQEYIKRYLNVKRYVQVTQVPE